MALEKTITLYAHKVKMQPNVSIITPTYNGAKHLRQSVESVLAQSYPHFELIIIDDGSTDETEALLPELQALAPHKISFFRFENAGLARARNRGIERAKGDYILPLDADDVLVVDALEKFVAAIQKRPEAAYAYCCVENFEFLPGQSRFWYQGTFTPGDLQFENHATATTLWDRKVFDRGLRYRDVIFEDWDFALQVVALGFSGVYIPEALFKYRASYSGLMGKKRFCKELGLVESITNNPSLYHDEVVRWAQNHNMRENARSEKASVVFLPACDSPLFAALDTELPSYIEECRAQGHFVAALGNYELGQAGRAGILLYPMGESVDIQKYEEKISGLGSEVIIFSEQSCEANACYANLPNVSLLIAKSETLPVFSRTRADLLPIAATSSFGEKSSKDFCYESLVLSRDALSASQREQKSHHHAYTALCTQASRLSKPRIEEAFAMVVIATPTLSELGSMQVKSLQQRNPKLEISVVEHRHEPHLAKALNSILSSTNRDYITIVDESMVLDWNLDDVLVQAAANFHFKPCSFTASPPSLFPMSTAESLETLRAQRIEASPAIEFLEPRSTLHAFPVKTLLAHGGFIDEFSGFSQCMSAALKILARAGVPQVHLPTERLRKFWSFRKEWDLHSPQNKKLWERVLSHNSVGTQGRAIIPSIVQPNEQVITTCLELEQRICSPLTKPIDKIFLLLELGERALEQSWFLASREAFETIKAMDPANKDILVFLAKVDSSAGLFNRSRHFLECILRDEPSHALASEWLERLGQHSQILGC